MMPKIKSTHILLMIFMTNYSRALDGTYKKGYKNADRFKTVDKSFGGTLRLSPGVSLTWPA